MYRNVLIGAVLPGIVALAVMLAAWWPRRAGRPRRGHWGGAAAFAAAPCVTFLCMAGWPTWPPAERWHRVVFVAAACGAVAAVAGWLRRPAWAPYACGPFAAGCCLLLLEPPEAPAHAILSPALLALWVVIAWAGLEPLAKRRPGVALPAALLVANVASALVLIEARNAVLALLATSLAAAAAAAVITGALLRHVVLTRGAIPVATAVGSALPVIGAWYDYGSVPVVAFGLVAATPLALWGAELPAARRLGPVPALLLRLGLVVPPAAVAVLLARSAGSPSPYGPLSLSPFGPLGSLLAPFG